MAAADTRLITKISTWNKWKHNKQAKKEIEMKETCPPYFNEGFKNEIRRHDGILRQKLFAAQNFGGVLILRFCWPTFELSSILISLFSLNTKFLSIISLESDQNSIIFDMII